MRLADLIIVGGGSLATASLAQLALRVEQTFIKRIIVFEPNRLVGPGVAYMDDLPSNILNTTADSMSVLPDRSDHFLQWLSLHKHEWQAVFPKLEAERNSFLPRALFGRYLSHVYEESCTILQSSGTSVEHLQLRIEDIRKIVGGYQLLASDGSTFQSPKIILATGNHSPACPSNLRRRNGYFHSPYPCKELVSNIDRLGTVGIVGTSLSAIDAAVSLVSAGHQGKMLMVSRSGRLPSVRGKENDRHSPIHLSRDKLCEIILNRCDDLNLQFIFDKLCEEFIDAGGTLEEIEYILKQDCGPQHYIESEVLEASAGARAWQSVLYGLNESIDLLWHHLPAGQRRLFMRQFKGKWNYYRVSFPLQNARQIQNLLRSNQLSVHAGCRKVSVRADGQRFVISLAQGGKAKADLYCDYLINATGYTSLAKSCQSKLVRRLIESGLASPDPFGGLRLRFQTGELISSNGSTTAGLYVLGSLAQGTYFGRTQ